MDITDQTEILKIGSKDSFSAIVEGIPAAGLAYKIVRAFIGAPLKLRQNRALEFFEMIRDNPTVLTKKILNSQSFQDGLVFFLEKYLVERSKRKRTILRSILLGFAKSGSLDEFELERLSLVATQINENDMMALSIFCDGTVEGFSKDSNYGYSCLQYGKLMLSEKRGYKEFENEDFTFEIFKHLSNVGILTEPVSSAGGMGSGYSNDRFLLTSFGKEFIKYIQTPG